MRKSLYLLFALPLFLAAQPEANILYFGQMAGLDFSGGNPVQLSDGAIETFEGCATYCSPTGQLLFYTNGGGRDPLQSGGQPSGKIWNRNHEVMYDMGFTEGGGFSAKQSSLIVPKPGADSVYYLFTMEEIEFDLGGTVVGQPQGRGLSYFEVDMRLNGGLGGVSVADERIYVPAYEGLTGTLHADGDKYWIITFQNDQNINQFVVVNADGGGFGNEDVSLQLVGFDFPLEASLKMTPAGNWLATGNYLFAFDKATGQIDVANPLTYSATGANAFSFTQDSRYFYFIDNLAALKRLDMTATDIVGSAATVATGPTNIFLASQMQMANNGSLYLLSANLSFTQTYLGEIRCPSAPDPLVDFTLFTYDNPENEFFLGLPNYTDHIFRRTLRDSIRLQPDTLTLCAGEMTTLAAPLDGPTYRWSTGADTPSITVDQGGTYRVTVTDECGYLTIKNFLVQTLPGVELTLTFPTDIDYCVGDTITLTASTTNPADTLRWSTGATTAQIGVTESDTYTITATNTCGEATASAALTFEDCEPLVECGLEVPNIFSPNQDGVNDIFGVFTNCVPTDFQLRIYSRWGKLIYSSNNYATPWEGAYNGAPAPADVYIYYLTYQLPNDTELQTVKGDLTLVR